MLKKFCLRTPDGVEVLVPLAVPLLLSPLQQRRKRGGVIKLQRLHHTSVRLGAFNDFLMIRRNFAMETAILLRKCNAE